jgi:hypothetical protein
MTLAVSVLAFAVLALSMWIASRRQQQMSSAEVERLMESANARNGEARIDDHELQKLPPPVARYLRLALPTSKHLRTVRIQQRGTLRTDMSHERWMAFQAEHIVVPPATGFVWNARVRVAPLMHVRVRDALIEGNGSGQVSLWSAFTVSRAVGTREMNAGSLHRYLAEAVWYPTALLPSAELTWTGIDDSTALATLTSYGTTVSLEFRFAQSGEVTGIFTAARWGTFPDGYRQVPWEGHFRDYRERDGVVVPSDGEVGWYIGGRWEPVWRGTITAYEGNGSL